MSDRNTYPPHSPPNGDDSPDAGQNGDGEEKEGALKWMAKNSVAANILMFIFLIGGLVMSQSIKQEVFPEFDTDLIIVNIPYPGASPEEVEKGVLLSVEESIRGINGIKRVRSTASEGIAVSTAELILGTDADQALNEIKAAVDRITSFPEDVERPTVFMARFESEVISVVFYGDQPEAVLKEIAERARDELLQHPRITNIKLAGVRPLEISIEVPQDNLRRYNLTLNQVSQRVKAASIELPGGGVKTERGEVLLRTAERRDIGQQYESIEVVSLPNGTKLYLGDIAEVIDGFADNDQESTYNGQRAVMLRVFRVGDQTPIEVSEIVRSYVADITSSLPPGVEVAEWFDRSDFYRERRDLLYRNALMGLVLVLLVLGLFLEVKLAFWVTLGIPISFLGALLLLPSMDVSINMISLFAFIVVLGMVVDDAIIVGESIYRWQQEGVSRLEAAVRGAKEVAVPVLFAILSTIVTFSPMLFIPGIMGKFFRVIPLVVIAALLLSLVESLLILPAHLAHSKPSKRGIFGFINRQQQRFSRGLENHIQRFYVPIVRAAIRRRYLTVAASVSISTAIIGGLVGGGIVQTEFFPSVDSDIIIAEIEMPYGTPVQRTKAVQDHLIASAKSALSELGDADTLSKGIFASLGSSGAAQGDPLASVSGGGHLAEISVYLVGADKRTFAANDFTRKWRQIAGEVVGVERIRFVSNAGGPASGAPVNLELSHTDLATLQAAAEELAARISDFAGTYDINDGFVAGKDQLDLELTAQAKALGLTETELALQVRSAFFGAEAVRQQRGRDELRVYVRLPRSERESEYNIEELIIRTPQGGEIPLGQAAKIRRGSSYTSITRIDGRRAVSVTAEVDEAVANANEIMGSLTGQVMPEILAQYPGLSSGLGGDAQAQQESIASLGTGFVVALGVIFALLAMVFRSYIHPFVVLLAVPFGIVGAVLGHWVMGYKLSLMSFMGIVALSGVVVNDSLVLIDAIKRLERKGMLLIDAVVAGGAMRFRPILLTSLTTFFGLIPMILETSMQARFLIPMAVSLGFGIIFATFITLLLVPAGYVILELWKFRLIRAWRLLWGNNVEIT